MIRNAAAARAVLFDKDGTLFDFQKSWGPVGARVVAELSGGDLTLAVKLANAAGYDIMRRSYRPNSPLVSGSSREIVEAWAALLPGWTVEGLEAWLNKRVAELSGSGLTPAVADLPGLLSVLRDAGLALGVATHDAEAAARTQLEAAGALSAFDFVAGYDSGFAPKPDGEVLAAFCAAADVSAGAVVVVGDSLADLELARLNGALAGVAVLSGPAPRSVLEPVADLVLNDIGALPPALGL